MKVRKTIKRALSMLLCVAMMMTTFDLSALTVRAGEGDMTTISGDNIVLNGDGVNVSGDEIGEGGDNNPSDIISDNDVDDASEDIDEESSISENSISENSISENTISDNSINPVGDSLATIEVGGYKITADDGSMPDNACYLKSPNGEYVIINTEEALTIELNDGVTSADKPIKAEHYGMTLNLTINNLKIDVSESSCYCGIIDASYSSLNLTIEGINEITGFESKNHTRPAICAGNYSFSPSAAYPDGDLVIGGDGTLILNHFDCAFKHSDITISSGCFKFIDCDKVSFTTAPDYKVEVTGGSFSTGDIRYQTVGPKMDSDTYYEKGFPVSAGYQLIETDDEDFPYKIVEATYQQRFMDYIISADDKTILERGKDYYIYNSNSSKEIVAINTEKPITIEMADGVDVTTVLIKAAKNGMELNITIKDICIDYSNVKVRSDYALIDAAGSTLNLTIEGDNTLIGDTNYAPSAFSAGKIYSTLPDGDLNIDGSGTVLLDSFDIAFRSIDLTITGAKFRIINTNFTFGLVYGLSILTSVLITGIFSS